MHVALQQLRGGLLPCFQQNESRGVDGDRLLNQITRPALDTTVGIWTWRHQLRITYIGSLPHRRTPFLFNLLRLYELEGTVISHPCFGTENALTNLRAASATK
jgi:hypothetical protein